MHIQKLRILNYKSFRDSGFIEFGPGFNVIVGQNNSGKTALLEALRLHLGEDKPHKRKDIPAGHPIDHQSHFEFDLIVTGDELVDSLVRTQGLPERQRLESVKRQYPVESLNGTTEVCCTLTTNCGGPWVDRHVNYGNPTFTLTASGKMLTEDIVNGDTDVFRQFHKQDGGALTNIVFGGLNSFFYAFKAERMNIGTYHLANEEILQPNAANLPAVLANMFSSKPGAYASFTNAVSEILPSIQLVQSRNIGNQYRIFIQNRGADPNRADLANGLEDCGAGVGQVLAILYVAMTMPPSVIMIDEPNSFLHPGAAKKLLQILSQYKHQYIISTHSSDIIASVDPDTLHLVQWDDGESKVKTLDRSNQNDLRLVLSEVGVGLSDIFATDRVIWVEGKTEEICFPLLVKAKRGSMPIGTSFIGLRNVSKFEGKKIGAQQILDLYTRLGDANGIMPTALAYSLDKEVRTAKEIDDLKREFKGKLHFLPRRCYENYLLDPQAISEVLSGHLSDGAKVTAEDVESWMKREGASLHPSKMHWGDAEFLKQVDSAKLLARLFSDLSATTVRYEKVKHSVGLTQWMIANQPDALSELTDYADSLVTF